MSEQPPPRPKRDFDPYYYFLGISPKDQPPDFYRLLGVERFEANLEIIEMASDRQLSHLHGVKSGDHIDDVAKLLSEVSRARLCLLSPKKKPEYDKQLKAHLDTPKRAPKSRSAPQSDDWLSIEGTTELRAAEENARPSMATRLEVEAQHAAAERAREQLAAEEQTRLRSTRRKTFAIAGGAFGLILLIATVVVAVLLSGGDEQESIADGTEVITNDDTELNTGDAGSNDPELNDSSVDPLTATSPEPEDIADAPTALDDKVAELDESETDSFAEPMLSTPTASSERGSPFGPDSPDKGEIAPPATVGVPNLEESSADLENKSALVTAASPSPRPQPISGNDPRNNPDLRQWASRSGEFTLQARYGGYQEELVTLIKSDGESVPVKLSELSDGDRQWVSSVEVDVILSLAGRQLAQQDSKQASEILFQGLQFPDDIRPDFYLGMIRALVDHDTSLAKRHFGNCVKQAPNHVPSLNNLAIAEMWEKNGSQSAVYLKRALELDPKCSEVVTNAALVLKLNNARFTSIPSTTRTFLEQQAQSGGLNYTRGGWHYMDYDDGTDQLGVSRNPIRWSWASLEDHRCFVCDDTRTIDCPNRKCSKGVVRVPTQQITGYNTITRAPITKTVYVPTRCPTCFGAGKGPCGACALVR